MKKASSPIEAVDIENGLSLIPRVKLLLTVYRADLSSPVSPIDEWQIKRSLLDYLKTISLIIPDEDLSLHKFKDIKKRKRQDPVASGLLYVRHLGFLNKQQRNLDLEMKLLEWRQWLVGKLDGMEVSLTGVKFRLNASLPESDDFQALNKSWEDFYAFNTRGENAQEGGDGIISGLQCKIVVQFEKHDDFYNALKVLCGRSMQKHGSRLTADYEATWDRNDFFGNTLQRTTKNHLPNKYHLSTTTRQHQNDIPRFQPQNGRFDSNDGVSSKRFKD